MEGKNQPVDFKRVLAHSKVCIILRVIAQKWGEL